jgi:hypothetical protein
MSDNEENTTSVIPRKPFKVPKKGANGAQMKKSSKQQAAEDEQPQTKKSAKIAASEQSKKRASDMDIGNNAAAAPKAVANPKAKIQDVLNIANKKSRNEYIPTASNSAALLAPSPNDHKKQLQELSFANVYSDESLAEWALEVKPVTSQFITHSVSLYSPKSKYINALTPPLTVTWSVLDGLGTMAPKNHTMEKAQYSARVEEGVPERAKAKDPKLEDRQREFFDRLHAACRRVLELMFDHPDIQTEFKGKLLSSAADQVLEVERAKGHKVKPSEIQEGGKLYDIVRKKALDAFISKANVYFNKKQTTNTPQGPGNKAKKPIITIKTDEEDAPKGPRSCYLQHYVFSSPRSFTDDADDADSKKGAPKGKLNNNNNNKTKAPAKKALGTIEVTKDQLKEASRGNNTKQLKIWRQRMEDMGYTWNEFQIVNGNNQPIIATDENGMPDWTKQRILGGALMNFMLSIKIYDLDTEGDFGLHLDMNKKAWFISQGTQNNTFVYKDETTAAEEYLSVEQTLAKFGSGNNNNTNFTFTPDDGESKDEEMNQDDPPEEEEQAEPESKQEEEEEEQKDPNEEEEEEEEREVPPNQMDVGGPAYNEPSNEDE